MGLFGKILSMPFKIVNAPIKAVETVIGKVVDEDIKILSTPLSELSKELEKVDEKEE